MTRIKNIISNQYHQLSLAERGRIEALRNCLRSSLNFDILLQKGNYDD